jgi:toxin ParE1/3/4
VAGDNPSAADRLLDTILESCQLYATQPAAGAPGDRFQKGLRYFAVGSYVVFYREQESGSLLIRILHGARNLAEIFQGERGSQS